MGCGNSKSAAVDAPAKAADPGSPAKKNSVLSRSASALSRSPSKVTHDARPLTFDVRLLSVAGRVSDGWWLAGMPVVRPKFGDHYGSPFAQRRASVATAHQAGHAVGAASLRDSGRQACDVRDRPFCTTVLHGVPCCRAIKCLLADRMPRLRSCWWFGAYALSGLRVCFWDDVCARCAHACERADGWSCGNGWLLAASRHAPSSSSSVRPDLERARTRRASSSGWGSRRWY